MAIAEVMGRRFVQYLKVTILLLITGAVFAGVFPTLALSTHEEDLKPAEVKSADLLDQSWCDQPLAENDPGGAGGRIIRIIGIISPEK